MLAALALIASAPATPQSAVVADLYRQACVRGEMRIDPKKGAVVSIHGLPGLFRRWMRWQNRQIERSTYVKMLDPPSTFVLITFYKDVKPGGVVSHCAVVSREIAFDDAVNVFFEGAPGRAHRSYNNGMWMEDWSIDRPQDGYRKSLWRYEAWIGIASEVYQKGKS
jgi:hypothetical protein